MPLAVVTESVEEVDSSIVKGKSADVEEEMDKVEEAMVAM